MKERAHGWCSVTAGRWLLLGGVAFAALVIAAVAVALARPTREATYPEGSPEALVQAYLRAMEAGEYESALGMVTKSQREACTVSDLFTQRLADRLKDARVEIKDVRVQESTARLTLTIRHDGAGSGPFNDSGYSEEQLVTLAKEDGVWRVGESGLGGGPWPLYYCGAKVPPPPAPVAPAATPRPATGGGA